MNEYQEKIRSLGFSLQRGSSRRKPVIDERDGSIGGHHVEHWDGSQDAVVRPKTLRVKARLEEER